MSMGTGSRTSTSTQPKKEAIVIGVDFGTTFSGVAWCYTGHPEKIRIINTWPLANNRISEKVPSIIQYRTHDPSKFRWGFGATTEAKNPVLRWFKLLLNVQNPTQSLSPGRAPSSAETLAGAYTGDIKQLSHLVDTIASWPTDKTPLIVATDYLSGLYKHIRSTLDASYPDSFTSSFGKNIALEFCLTVPAIWTDIAKDLTLQAARAAEFDESQVKIKIVSEPEAAAVHCLKTFQETEDCLKVGDVYVIADCGGGTVDLICYTVTSVEPRLRVDETVAGTGGLCGSTALDRRFVKLVKKRLAGEWDNMNTVARSHTMRHFEEFLKPTFCAPEYLDVDEDDDESETAEYHCPVPGVTAKIQGVHRGNLTLSAHEMQQIFEPTFAEILELVQQQVSKAEREGRRPVTGILLVGGFGTSEYLYKYLSAKVRGKDGDPIKILRPNDAWSAIARGAVSYAMAAREEREGHVPAGQGLVGSRIARCSYGIGVSEYFIAGEHSADKMYVNMFTGHLMCEGRIRWFIKKGERLDDGDRKKIWSLLVDAPTGAERDEMCYPQMIYASTLNNPPEDDDDNDVHLLLTFTADMNGIPRKKHFTRKRGAIDNRAYWEIPITACLEYKSASLEFSIKVGVHTVGTGITKFNHPLWQTGGRI